MKNVSILIVEDENEFRQTLSVVISRQYKTVITAENGQIGLEKYREFQPDLIITDIQMPVLDGLSMVEELRKEDTKIPILVISAFNDTKNLMRAINVGVDRFLPKPIDITFLKRELQKSAEVVLNRKSRVMLEQKMTILTQAILNSDDATCIYSKNGELVFFNDAFFKCFGKQISELLQKGDLSIFSEHPEILEKLETKHPAHWNLDLKVTTGCEESKHFRIKSSPVLQINGEPLGTLLIFHDISDIIHLENALQAEKEQALQSARFKTEFLSTVSHDIRTPMSLIMGLTDLLINEAPQKEQLNHLNLMKKSAQNLMHLINDILDISKIEEGKLIIEKVPFSPKETLDYLQELFSQKAKDKNIDFSIHYDESLQNSYQGDPYRLQQILVNLIGNSFKFTPGGHITVFVRELSRQNQETLLEFCVSDSGKGIDPARLKTIFDKFEQEDASITRNYGGTGLGTSIAKNLTELMGGEISVISPARRVPGDENNPGSEFTFTIRVKQLQEKPFAPGETQEEITSRLMKKLRERKLSALIAEDNPVNQLLLKKILNLFEVHSDVAHDGDEAFDMAIKGGYDVIFMDIEMPGSNGVETTIKLRNNQVNTPIIACTAHNFKDDLESYLEAGMNHYLVKPVNKNSVIDPLLYVLSLEQPVEKPG